MKNRILLPAILLLLSACVNGPARLEFVSARVPSPSEVRITFSESVERPEGSASAFRIFNASTGAELSVASVSGTGTDVTLKMAPASVLAAGHVYDLDYDFGGKTAGDDRVRASGRERFLADYLPPDKPLSPLEAFRDSAGRVLLLWTSDHRIGNTAQEIWFRPFGADSVLLATLTPDRSAHRIAADPGPGSFALRFLNEFGKSDLAGWKAPRPYPVAVFPCFDRCLADSAAAPVAPGFTLLESGCDLLLYAHDSTGAQLVRRITPSGVMEYRESVPGRGFSDSLDLHWCP